jgi:cell wall-associated NlpC family hydrolase
MEQVLHAQICPGGAMIRYLMLTAVLVLLFAVTTPTQAATIHKVRENETLYSISRSYGVRTEALKEANNLVANRISSGDLLVIPAATASERQQSAARHRSVAPTSSRASVADKTANQFSDIELEQYFAELVAQDPDRNQLQSHEELKSNAFVALKRSAFSFLGTRYRFGGETRRGIDCSSFTQQVFRELDVDLPRTAREQYKLGDDVPPEALQRGDLLFFRTYARFPSHVGIYIGDRKMIHASSGSKRVVISTIDKSYYQKRFIGAKRIREVNPQMARLDDLLVGIDVDEERGESDIAPVDLSLQRQE